MALLRIHDRYLLQETLAPFVISVAACLMMMTVQELYQVMQLLTSHRFPLAVLAQYLFFKGPIIIQKSLPVALLLGSALGLSRMIQDGELTPLRIGGLPLRRLFVPLAAAGFVFSVISYHLSEHVTPYASHRAEAMYRQLTFQSQVAGLAPDTFFRSEDRIFYFHTAIPTSANESQLQDVLVYFLGTGGSAPLEVPDTASPVRGSVFWTAARGQATGQVWRLEDVVEHRVSRDGHILSDRTLPPQQIDLKRDIRYFLSSQETAQELTASELNVRIQASERMGLPASVVLPLKYEFGFRLALPFACLVFSLVSAPLVVRFARGGSMIGVLIAFGVLFFYYDVMVIAEKLALAGALAPTSAAWMPNMVFGAMGIALAWAEP